MTNILETLTLQQVLIALDNGGYPQDETASDRIIAAGFDGVTLTPTARLYRYAILFHDCNSTRGELASGVVYVSLTDATTGIIAQF